MSDPRTTALADLTELPVTELTRRRTELQAAAEAAGASLDEIGEALNARADLPRPLLPEEHDALFGLLRHHRFPGRDSLLQQAEVATVVGYCACGCASVDLAVPPSARPAATAPAVVPTGADISDDAGNVIGGLIVFLVDGYLSLLEIYDYDAPISPMPPLGRLTFSG